jgi:hypothetical protein
MILQLSILDVVFLTYVRRGLMVIIDEVAVHVVSIEVRD